MVLKHGREINRDDFFLGFALVTISTKKFFLHSTVRGGFHQSLTLKIIKWIPLLVYTRS